MKTCEVCDGTEKGLCGKPAVLQIKTVDSVWFAVCSGHLAEYNEIEGKRSVDWPQQSTP